MQNDTTAAPVKESSFVSGAELMEMTFPPSDWIVDGLLRTGRRRPSILGGEPHSGKSTIATQLLCSVTSGREFLGRKTIKAPCLYFQTEDELSDVKIRLRRQGYNPAEHAPLYIYREYADKNPLQTLRTALLAHPEVKLVVVETMDDLLRIKDINKNSDAREAFERFSAEMGALMPDTCFLLLHHLNKSAGLKGAGKKGRSRFLSGASWIAGKTDTEIYVTQPIDGDERRMVNAEVREGTRIPETWIEFDPQTTISTLGETYSESVQNRSEQIKERIASEIITVLARKPMTQDDCLKNNGVQGNTQEKERAFNKLKREGAIYSEGNGVKGSPRLWHLREIPMEEAA